MKYTLTFLLSALLLCGCSQQHAGYSTLDLVQAGSDLTLNDGHYVLHVEKREGSSIQGVKIVATAPNGVQTIITSDKGNVSEGSDPHFIKIVLYDGKNQKADIVTPFQKCELSLSR
jgi:major membrane immunogen (membrane-anchored lipoprotein)